MALVVCLYFILVSFQCRSQFFPESLAQSPTGESLRQRRLLQTDSDVPPGEHGTPEQRKKEKQLGGRVAGRGEVMIFWLLCICCDKVLSLYAHKNSRKRVKYCVTLDYV